MGCGEDDSVGGEILSIPVSSGHEVDKPKGSSLLAKRDNVNNTT